MTIREAAFSLCKEIQQWPFRQEVKDLLHRIDTTTDARSQRGDNYGELGYLAKQQFLEILGYLAINAKADEIHKLPVPLSIKKLDAHELDILETGHRFITEAIQQCAGKLDPQLPNISTVLSPYSRIAYTLRTTPNQRPGTPSATALVDAFQTHPCLRAITATINALPQIKTLTPPQIAAGVLGVEQQIAKHGLFSAPSEFHELSFQPRNPGLVMKTFLFNLVGLRSSLRNAAHLMYQAFRFQHLPVLNNDNVFQIEKQVGHALGESIRFVALPEGIENYPHSPNPGDIIVVKLKLDHGEINGEFFTAETAMSFSRDFGSSLWVGTRRIDANLNYYPRLTPPGQ